MLSDDSSEGAVSWSPSNRDLEQLQHRMLGYKCPGSFEFVGPITSCHVNWSTLANLARFASSTPPSKDPLLSMSMLSSSCPAGSSFPPSVILPPTLAARTRSFSSSRASSPSFEGRFG